MANVTQGLQAGALANGVVAAQAFIAALQAAIAAGQSVSSLTVGLSGVGPASAISFFAPVTVADSVTVLNTIANLANGLAIEWTAALTPL